jgi:hypothetical protein
VALLIQQPKTLLLPIHKSTVTNCVAADSKIGNQKLCRCQVRNWQRWWRHFGFTSCFFLGVYKFIFLADFIINDMEKDHQNPLILRCWFLATGRNRCPIWQAHIRVQDEQVTFNVF